MNSAMQLIIGLADTTGHNAKLIMVIRPLHIIVDELMNETK